MKKLFRTFSVFIATTAVMLTLSAYPVSAAWRQNRSGWWYDEGNSWAVGWKCIDNSYYFFNQDGYMKTGWIYDRGWYFLKDNGQMMSNTNCIIGDRVYSFDGTGRMVSFLANNDEEAKIKELNFINIKPYEGQSIADNFIILPENSRYFVSSVLVVGLNQGDIFKSGQNYRMIIRVVAKPGYKIAKNNELTYDFNDKNIVHYGNVETDNGEFMDIFVAGVTCR